MIMSLIAGDHVPEAPLEERAVPRRLEVVVAAVRARRHRHRHALGLN